MANGWITGRGARLALGLGLVLQAMAAPAETPVAFSVAGGDKGLTSALKSASGVITAGASKTAGTEELFAAAQADYGRLLGALYAAGYYSGVIHIRIDGREAAAIPPLDAPKRIGRIEIVVEPGPAFTFGRAEAAPLAPGTDLPEGFRPGAPAPSGTIVAAADAAVGGWRDAGHPKARVAGQSIVADHRQNRLDASIALAPGPEARFGRLAFTGTTRVREDRLRAIAGFPTGKPFSPEQADRVAKRLRDSGAFRSVALTEAERLNPDGTLDMTAALVDEAKRRLGFGIEVASLDGLTLSGYWLHRNLFGGAERLRIDGEVSGIGAQTGGRDYRFSARLERPATFGTDTTGYVSGLAERLNEEDYSEDIAAVEVGLERALSNRLSGSAGVGLRYSRVDRSGTRTTYSALILPLAITYDSRDAKLDAHRGLYAGLGLTPFLGLAGSDSGAQVKLDLRGYRSLGSRFVLAGRVQVGSILGASVAGTPPDYLFYSGGGGSVRGQPYQSLGVYVLSPTDRSGGKSFLAVSGEVRAKVTGSIGAVAFYDLGFVGADSMPGRNGGWQAGAGLGLRYDTGIGPLRLDLAFPVRGDTGTGMQLYLGIGQAF